MPTAEEILVGAGAAGATAALVHFGIQSTIARDLDDLPGWANAGVTAAISTGAGAGLSTLGEAATESFEAEKHNPIDEMSIRDPSRG